MDGAEDWDASPQPKRRVEVVYSEWHPQEGGTMKHFMIRHNSGEYFEVQAWTTARLRKLIQFECADRGWELDDTVVIEIERQEARNERRQQSAIAYRKVLCRITGQADRTSL